MIEAHPIYWRRTEEKCGVLDDAALDRLQEGDGFMIVMVTVPVPAKVSVEHCRTAKNADESCQRGRIRKGV